MDGHEQKEKNSTMLRSNEAFQTRGWGRRKDEQGVKFQGERTDVIFPIAFSNKYSYRF